MKKILIPLVLIAAAAAAWWHFGAKKEFLYAGTVEATDVDLSARLSSVIADIPLKEGDDVKTGQTLVRLACEDVIVAEEAAQRDYKRAVELLNIGAMNQEAFDRLRFKRDDAAVRLGWCRVKSPLDGTVLEKYHENGEIVNPGTKLLTLADLSKVWAYIYVPQPMLARLSVNMKLSGVVPEAGMRKIEGRISRIKDEAEFTPKNVQTREERTRLVYGIKVEFDNDDRFLKPGMTVEIRLPE